MANSEAETSSDAAQVLGGEYQVFLSFRGPDTRAGFTDFLYHDLVDAGVHVFRDDEELRVGDVIGGSLLHAINNSKIYIPIFSQTYASSRWCLWELAHILDNVSKSEGEKNILPIFLDVEPDDVKLKTPQYENDLQEHKKKFPAEVEAWRAALVEVCSFKGFNVKSSPAKNVKLVVEMVLEKLETKKETVTQHLLGLDNRVKDLIESLDVNDPDVRLIGIFGMGGIGKTTIAKVVYNQLSSHFGKCCSFLENVRERSSTEEGIVKLQKKLLLDVGCRYVEKVEDIAKGMKRIGETLCNKKVLVVLDDVHDKEHIMKLIGISKLYSGSRVIITTRDTTTLQVEGFITKIQRYEMQKMDDSLALQLFCQHAFGRDVPLNDFHKLSSEIVSLMGGLPLAIEVVSSLLKETKDEELWKETLVKLRKAPEEAILEKLRISYDNLHKTQQQIFLDIACFFVNEKKTDATYIWADCDYLPVRGINVLIERCLIKILQGGKLWMHDQLIALGRQIVRDESQDGLGKQSRLWIVEEALEIIKTKDRKDKVQALQIVRPSYNIEIANEEFERLQNLRCLKLNKGTYVGDFASCQSNLRWFSWHSPRVMDFRAKNLYLVHLVVCKLDDLNFKDDSKAWDLIKRSQKLKVLSMTSCYGITTIPNISRCSALEMLTLTNCWNLKKIESFIGNLHSLIELKIEKCSNFTDLPEEVGALVKLKHFSLSGCEGLRNLPNSLGNLISLTELNLSGTSIVKLPNSIEGLVNLESFLLTNTGVREFPNFIGNLKSLRVLCLSKDRSIWQLSHEISSLKNLGELLGIRDLLEISELPSFIRMLVTLWQSMSLPYFRRSDEESYSLEANAWLLPSGISMSKNLEELDFHEYGRINGQIPVEIGELLLLRNLNLKETYICGIPMTIIKLRHLQRLNLWNCNMIKRLPKLPSSLTHLALKSKSLLSIPDLSNLTNLVELELSDGSRDMGKSNLITVLNFRGIGRLSKLKMVYLDLLNTPAPPKFASLSHLEELDLYGLDLRPIGGLPSSSWNWRNLLTLNLCRCEMQDIPLGLPRLENLILSNCTVLERLSIPSELRELQLVHLQYCPELVEIQVVGLSHSLKSLKVCVCKSLNKIGGLSYLKKLKNLQIEKCDVLTDVEGLNELESLQFLSVSKCPLLRSLINAYRTNIPDDCHVQIDLFGDSIEDSIWSGRTSKHSIEIVSATPYKVEHPFTIIFVLGAKKKSKEFGFAGGIKWMKENVTPGLVTYRELIAEVKGCGFRMERMWYVAPGKDHVLLIEIKGDEQVNGMVQAASQTGFIDLYVEVGTDIRSQGAIIWASHRDCSVHLFFLICALFLSLLLSRVFPGKPHFLNFFSGYYLECVLILLGFSVDRCFSPGSP